MVSSINLEPKRFTRTPNLWQTRSPFYLYPLLSDVLVTMSDAVSFVEFTAKIVICDRM